MARQDAAAEQADVTQMRAELGMLRALYQQQFDKKVAEDADRAKHLEYLAWVALTAQEKTQLVADKIFKATPGDSWWTVELKEQPLVKLPAHSEFEAIGRYNQLCGITGTEHQHIATRLEPEEQVVVGAT